MKDNKKKFAFTLAEALLTITIIGVTTALMMRAINRVNPDKEKILFVKTYHAIEQVIANTINDPGRYDQNFYSDDSLLEEFDTNSDGELDETEIAEKNKLIHNDFTNAPLDDAIAIVAGKEIKNLTKDNAICYFIADGLNYTGELNCDNNNTVNLKTTTGVCLRGLYGFGTEYSNIGIDPSENCEKSDKSYEVLIYKDGKLTVPETPKDDSRKTRQATAYNWMQSQTQVK